MTLLDALYGIVGIYLLINGFFSLKDLQNEKRYGTAAFWSIFGFLIAFGSLIPEWVSGILVIMLALIPGFGYMAKGKFFEISTSQKKQSADEFGFRLFIPLVLIPVGTIFIAVGTPLGALMGLGLSALAALIAALALTGESFFQATQEGRRTLDSLGWTAVISQFLATIGLLFNIAGVGATIEGFASGILLGGSKFVAVAAYCFGMMFFSFVLGNAFAAFAIVTTGIGLPFVVNLHGCDPSIVCVLAMLSGYSGSVISPLAGNFTLVPTVLLKIQDRYGIAKVELPIVVLMLFVNIIIMYFFS